MDKTMWTKEIIELLLFQYKKHKNLYDVGHPKYLDQIQRAHSLTKICEHVQKLEPRITVKALKNKIYIMRSQFAREIKKLKSSDDTGDGTDDPLRPGQWWFPHMEYMRPFIGTRHPVPIQSYVKRHSIKVKNEQCRSQSIDSEGSNCETQQSFYAGASKGSPNISSSTPAKKIKLECGLMEHVDKVKKLVEKNATERSEYDWLISQVDFEFTKLENDNIKMRTAWKIQDILRDATLKDRELKRQMNKK